MEQALVLESMKKGKKNMKSKYIPTIGLEIHVELNSSSKMFCSCANDSEADVNSNACETCLGHPGSLPVINKLAVEKVLQVGLALGCKIAEKSYFDRKNYFYPDLPKGYQISQHFAPFCKNGSLNGIGISEVHLEEDTCKLVHVKNSSLVDCNRSGVPLMELVSEPELKSALEARKFAQELKLLFKYLNVSEADMEKGQMRIEANVSVSKSKKLGTKVELKNINSFKAVEKAIDFEIKRQTERLDSGKEIVQQTRGWDADKEQTVQQRIKETSEDYRYFPEPDLPLLEISKKYLKTLEIPELPWEKRKRLSDQYQDLGDIDILVQNKELGQYFEKTVSYLPDVHSKNYKKMIKLCFNYLTSDLLGLIGEKEINISPDNFSELIVLIHGGKISSKAAKDVLAQMVKKDEKPSKIVKNKGLGQISDKSEIQEIVKQVIADHKKPVLDFKQGKQAALQFLVGQIMRVSKGKVNPKIAEEILRKSIV